MNKIKFGVILLGFLLTCVSPGNVWAFSELTDQQLTAVTAGSVDASSSSTEALTRIPFRYSGKNGEVDGEILVVPIANYNTQGSLQLMDNAQSNLSSLINVNAVNSPVQILLNLNVTVNSSIGSINQLNHLLSD